MKRQYDSKVETIQNMNYELRKSFLKELHLLRESYYMRSTSQIDTVTAQKHAANHLFQYDAGLDKQICDLLNTKIRQVSAEYLARIQDQ